MKRLSLALISVAFLSASVGSASAELVTIYGPVYIAKTKKDSEHRNKEAKIEFTAPVPGAGRLVIKNGGDSGEKARVSAAEIELNGKEVVRHREFNKRQDVLQYDVNLLANNKMAVEVKSCKDCEIEITVLGEMPAPPPSRTATVSTPDVPLRTPVP